MKYTFCRIGDSEELMLKAAKILNDAFMALGNSHWPDFEAAIKEVRECIAAPNICIGLCDEDELLGWVGLRPMYKTTWELHPMVVNPSSQKNGIGRMLIAELENIAKEQGIIGIVLGTDDEHDQTSLSQVDIDSENILREIAGIRNLNRHPFEFYKKCGYSIVGIIPNANGRRKPDIWMWKDISSCDASTSGRPIKQT